MGNTLYPLTDRGSDSCDMAVLLELAGQQASKAMQLWKWAESGAAPHWSVKSAIYAHFTNGKISSEKKGERKVVVSAEHLGAQPTHTVRVVLSRLWMRILSPCLRCAAGGQPSGSGGAVTHSSPSTAHPQTTRLPIGCHLAPTLDLFKRSDETSLVPLPQLRWGHSK